MDRWTDGLTDLQRRGWEDDGRMERGASKAKATDKSETGSGSSSEVASTAPPGPEKEQERDTTLPLCSIDLTHYHHYIIITQERVS